MKSQFDKSSSDKNKQSDFSTRTGTSSQNTSSSNQGVNQGYQNKDMNDHEGLAQKISRKVSDLFGGPKNK